SGRGGDDERRVDVRNLHPTAQRGIPRTFVGVVGSDHVGDEHGVKQSAFERTRQIGPVIQRRIVHASVAWKRPQSVVDMAGCTHFETIYLNSFAHWSRSYFDDAYTSRKKESFGKILACFGQAEAFVAAGFFDQQAE